MTTTTTVTATPVTQPQLVAMVETTWDYLRRIAPFGGLDVETPISGEDAETLRAYMLKRLEFAHYITTLAPRSACDYGPITEKILDDPWKTIEYVWKVAQPIAHYTEMCDARAAAATPAPKAWAWQPYIPKGAVTLLAGHPGAAKSWLATAIAANLASGLHGAAPASTLYYTTDRDLVLARYAQQDGAPAHFEVRSLPQGKTLDEMLDNLVTDLDAAKPTLVVLDALSDLYLVPERDDKRGRAKTINRIAPIARRNNTAILVITDLQPRAKTTTWSDLQEAKMLAPIARSILIADECLDASTPHRRLIHAKANLSALGETLAFTIDDGGFAWIPMPPENEDSLQHPESATTQLDTAIDYLYNALFDGPQPAATLIAKAPCALNTLKQAKQRLAVIAIKSRTQHGAWLWQLPATSQPTRNEIVEPAKDVKEVEEANASTQPNTTPNNPPKTTKQVKEVEEAKEANRNSQNNTPTKPVQANRTQEPTPQRTPEPQPPATDPPVRIDRSATIAIVGPPPRREWWNQ